MIKNVCLKSVTWRKVLEIILFESVNRRWGGQGESSQSWRERWQKHINLDRGRERDWKLSELQRPKKMVYKLLLMCMWDLAVVNYLADILPCVQCAHLEVVAISFHVNCLNQCDNVLHFPEGLNSHHKNAGEKEVNRSWIFRNPSWWERWLSMTNWQFVDVWVSSKCTKL